MKIKKESEIIEFCSQFASPLGLEVVQVEFKQGKNPTMTIFIDKEGGVDLDSCEAFHRAILEPIDELDPTFGEAYTLNVSSLGADRPFKTEKDFLSNIDKMVEVNLYSGIKGKKFLEGVLLSYTPERIVIKIDPKNTLSIEMKNIKKVNKYIDIN